MIKYGRRGNLSHRIPNNYVISKGGEEHNSLLLNYGLHILTFSQRAHYGSRKGDFKLAGHYVSQVIKVNRKTQISCQDGRLGKCYTSLL